MQIKILHRYEGRMKIRKNVDKKEKNDQKLSTEEREMNKGATT